ncbi:MAG: phosphoribosyl-AMP cyclohydrolase [Gammaproteobacteria bacterium]|nr:phosphoribosyl-AMP cyclohydrolase [Gammaproteobacteria bacterium]
MSDKKTAWLDQVKWTDDGLVPVIAQDATSGRILMMAWMNRESLLMTAEKNEAVYWSRSRQKLWHKGESSGHTQKVKSIRLDCDADVIVLQVEQLGGIACHTGRESCFYSELNNSEWQVVEAVIKDPKEIYQ